MRIRGSGREAAEHVLFKSKLEELVREIADRRLAASGDRWPKDMSEAGQLS